MSRGVLGFCCDHEYLSSWILNQNCSWVVWKSHEDKILDPEFNRKPGGMVLCRGGCNKMYYWYTNSQLKSHLGRCWPEIQVYHVFDVRVCLIYRTQNQWCLWTHKVKNWWALLKEAVYNAEDISDEIATEAQQCKDRSCWSSAQHKSGG